jgi:hypothetical protein
MALRDMPHVILLPLAETPSAAVAKQTTAVTPPGGDGGGLMAREVDRGSPMLRSLPAQQRVTSAAAAAVECCALRTVSDARMNNRQVRYYPSTPARRRDGASATR